jgi:hypothetical protein
VADDPNKARVIALLSESLDLFASVTAVCRVLPEERAFAVGVLKIDVPTFEAVEAKWKQRLERDAVSRAMFHTLVSEYEFSFRQLQAGGVPVVEGSQEP